ncbi:type II toxin-antitoxin system RelE/ParE family toxin [Ignavigranum ruoffiae]|uniref:type II toxin-antitoxin system RelE/ParE family toxin n=1 Tax=Ignavigranum ruoffiae TaxID=89093 RepID=UPI00206B74F0|nr:type II toxin-antitoxin system RelE/ParE family toxin [Ignavigranum ruoffiae]UPQ85049.1 type II toxin-antitoxin system RelE/ParE family toxin [Ignavigranum ruoffiae]
MTNNQILVNETAKNDLQNIVNYLKFNFKSPALAHKFLIGIEQTMSELAYFPQKFQLVSDSFLTKRGFRKIHYKNYLIFYTINIDQKIVYIHRILYYAENGHN